MDRNIETFEGVKTSLIAFRMMMGLVICFFLVLSGIFIVAGSLIGVALAMAISLPFGALLWHRKREMRRRIVVDKNAQTITFENFPDSSRFLRLRDKQEIQFTQINGLSYMPNPRGGRDTLAVKTETGNIRISSYMENFSRLQELLAEIPYKEEAISAYAETVPRGLGIFVGIHAGLFGVGLLCIATFLMIKVFLFSEELIIPYNAAVFFVLFSLIGGIFLSHIAWSLILGTHVKRVVWIVLGCFFVLINMSLAVVGFLHKDVEAFVACLCTLPFTTWCFTAAGFSSGKPLLKKH